MFDTKDISVPPMLRAILNKGKRAKVSDKNSELTLKPSFCAVSKNHAMVASNLSAYILAPSTKEEMELETKAIDKEASPKTSTMPIITPIE